MDLRDTLCSHLNIFVPFVSLCFPLVHALDTAPKLSSTILLDRNLVIVISLECARHIYSLTMRLDSGCAANFARCLSPCSLHKLSVFPLSFVAVPSFSRSYNTDESTIFTPLDYLSVFFATDFGAPELL